MTMQDPVSDMITRIKNAQMANFSQVNMPSSKMKEAIAQVLKEQGYIADFKTDASENIKTLSVKLKYFNGKPVIENIKRVSRPGLRVYKQHNDIPVVKGGLGVAIVSTSKGLMTGRQAANQSLGGEIICLVS